MALWEFQWFCVLLEEKMASADSQQDPVARMTFH